MWLSSDSTTSAGWIQHRRQHKTPPTSTHPLLLCNTHTAPSMHPSPSWRAVNGDIYLDDIPISTLGDMHPEHRTLPDFTWNIRVFVCSWICEVWLRSSALCVKWRRVSRSEQIKKGANPPAELGCESSNRRWRSQPEWRSFSSLCCFNQSILPMIPSPTLHCALFLHNHAATERHNRRSQRQKKKKMLSSLIAFTENPTWCFFSFFPQAFGKYSSLSTQKANYWSHLGD